MGSLERLIRHSLRQRWLVLVGTGLLMFLGAVWITNLPVDIFPDLSAPTVTVITEAPGMAPEEIELLVTFPVESAVNGSPGVRRLRSVSADGISVLWVEFHWGTDIYQARQMVTERLQRIDLPAQAERPELGPISSIMGEITFIALTSGTVVAARAAPIWQRPLFGAALLAIPGISQVVLDRRRRAGIPGGRCDPAALTASRQSPFRKKWPGSSLRRASRNPAAGFPR